jgi:dipeptidyl aminopeptidase/acylaminoacyl peptidase
MKKSTKSILCIVICGALGMCWLKYQVCRDHSEYFKQRKGVLSSSTISQYHAGDILIRQKLSLRSDSGLTVEGRLLVPKNETSPKRYPVVIVLAGLETGQHAVDYVRAIPNVIIAAMDYPYNQQDLDTPRKVLGQMGPLRKAALDTVPSVMLLLDYLAKRPDVDMKKVVLVGLSMGAIFVPCISVEDGRPDLAVMVFGGGDLREIIRHNLRGFSGEMESDLLSYLGGLLMSPMEPMRFVDRISPTPLLMINGTRDQMIPRRCTEELFEKAKAPKKLIWLDSRHLTPGDTKLTKEIVETLRKQLTETTILSSDRDNYRIKSVANCANLGGRLALAR